PTGLVWQRKVAARKYGWADAKEACRVMSLDAYAYGWKLPTKKQLETLVDHEIRFTTIDALAFPETPRESYWSSTIVVDMMGFEEAWAVDFVTGTSKTERTSTALAIRCVHEP
ncbi:MAG: DUF1566 domain-containing protein, partial [Deltaproteobacteria bacterium]|nr:DUF1566 domain-containing protein [Deltaproteobacteria bacterium]